MDSKEFNFGKESKNFLKKENKKLRDCVDNISKGNSKIVVIIAVLSIVSAVIGAAVGAWLQAGGFNPPPESNVDILFQGINETSNFYLLDIINFGNTPSNTIFLIIQFHGNISIQQGNIWCNKDYVITEINKNSVNLKFNMLIPPPDYILLKIPFNIKGNVSFDEYLLGGTLSPSEEESKNLLEYKTERL